MKIGGISGYTGSFKSVGGDAFTKIISNLSGHEQSMSTSMPGGAGNVPLNSVYKSPFQSSHGAGTHAIAPLEGGANGLPKEYQDAINWKRTSVNDTTFLALGTKIVKDTKEGINKLLT